MKKIKTLTSKDHVSIIFGEWFDKINGNTYYDATIRVNDNTFGLAWRYGYNAGDQQSIDEALYHAGYKVRKNNRDRWASYKNIHIMKRDVLKRDLIKTNF